MKAEPELWHEIAEPLQSKTGPFRIHHVESHRDPDFCTTEHEVWTAFHMMLLIGRRRTHMCRMRPLFPCLDARARRELQEQVHQATLVLQLQWHTLCCASSRHSQTRFVADTGVTALLVAPRSVPLLLGSLVSVQGLNRTDVRLPC